MVTSSATTKRYLPWVVATALFMEQLDSTIVNTGIPAMAASLGVTPLSLKAVVTSYILSLAVSIPISGWLAERYGSRRIFMLAVALFTLSSVLCGLTVNSTMLIAARVAQGIAAAMMMPVGRMAILRTFPKAELLQAMNFVIIPALLGPLLGPTVGGLIVHWFTWREIFFVNIPLGLLALWFAKNYMPNYKSGTPRPLDVRSLLLFASGAGLLSWLLEVFGEIDLPSGTVAMLAAVALGLLAAYGWHAFFAAAAVPVGPSFRPGLWLADHRVFPGRLAAVRPRGGHFFAAPCVSGAGGADLGVIGSVLDLAATRR